LEVACYVSVLALMLGVAFDIAVGDGRLLDFVKDSYFCAGVKIACFLFAEAYLDVVVFPVMPVYLLFD